MSTISLAGTIFVRWRPGSPWIPMPTSISSSPISKSGVPRTGGVHELSAMPIVRTLAMTFSPTRTHSSSEPPLSAGARRLDDEEVAGHAAPADRPGRVLDGHVVVDEERLDLHALGLAQLPAHLPRGPVAGVVVDDVEDAHLRVHELRGLDDEVDRRAGEDVAGAGRVEHALADDHRVGRLVARSRSPG